MEELENRSGGGAAGAAETLGVTETFGTPRPLRLGLKESREPARRQRTVGVGTPVLGGGGGKFGGREGAARLRGPRLSPSSLPLLSKARKLRHTLAETLLSWLTPFHLRRAPLSWALFFQIPGLSLPGLETPLQPLTRAAGRSRGPPPAQSHLGQQDEELLLAKGLGAAGTHAPLGRNRPAAPGLADLPLLTDQATGQCRHGAPGGDTPKPAGARSALGSPQKPAH